MTSTAAYPGCQAIPGDAAQPPDRAATLAIYLPDIHCAACISNVERALAAAPGVRAARVNLTQKRATVDAEPWVETRDLVTALDRAGIAALELDAAAIPQSDPAERAMLLRLGLAGFAMMNVMLLSVAIWSGATDATRDLFHWLAALIAIPAALFAAQPLFRSAISALSARRLNMDVPISLAILLALGLSLYETALSGQHAYFDAALALTFFLLVGRYLDLRVRGRARSAARELAALEVPRAIRIDGAKRTEVRAASLAPGDLILVPPRTRLPADGAVTEASPRSTDRSSPARPLRCMSPPAPSFRPARSTCPAPDASRHRRGARHTTRPHRRPRVGSGERALALRHARRPRRAHLRAHSPPPGAGRLRRLGLRHGGHPPCRGRRRRHTDHHVPLRPSASLSPRSLPPRRAVSTGRASSSSRAPRSSASPKSTPPCSTRPAP